MLLPYMESGRIEAGCDEAGRGCLAGAVFAAAVILPPDYQHPLLNDSKQLSEKQRYALRPVIEQEAVAWAVGIAEQKLLCRIKPFRLNHNLPVFCPSLQNVFYKFSIYAAVINDCNPIGHVFTFNHCWTCTLQTIN